MDGQYFPCIVYGFETNRQLSTSQYDIALTEVPGKPIYYCIAIEEVNFYSIIQEIDVTEITRIDEIKKFNEFAETHGFRPRWMLAIIGDIDTEDCFTQESYSSDEDNI